MKSYKFIRTLGVMTLAALTAVSCDDYLDKNPDNRTEIDTEDKVVSLLGFAYPEIGYSVMAECMSDNMDDMAGDIRYLKYDARFYNQAFYWKTITETDNDGAETFWGSYYAAVANANQALASIEEMGGATTLKMKEAKAEALLCRAYGLFVLANMFCQAYDSQNAANDLGLPYPTEPETTLESLSDRGTLADLYAKIDKDIQEALPYINDTHYTQPKYHFNRQAAFAFAARFYLYYEQWDKVVKYANEAIGSNPKSLLRNWVEMESYGITDDLDPRTQLYVKSGNNCNFLLIPTYSYVGYFQSNYSYVTRYSHNEYISKNETLDVSYPFWTMLRCPSLSFVGGAMNRVLVAKLPKLFEMTDIVSQTGFFHSVEVPFKADALLLERAEAYVLLKQYDKALADLQMWMENYAVGVPTLTVDMIREYYSGLKYYEPSKPTPRKRLNPRFTIDEEGSVQECMLQCVLNMKRIENIHEGMRWFDIKRYGIVIPRRMMNSDCEVQEVVDTLVVRDQRCALQIPPKVLGSGFQANPRTSKDESASMEKLSLGLSVK